MTIVEDLADFPTPEMPDTGDTAKTRRSKTFWTLLAAGLLLILIPVVTVLLAGGLVLGGSESSTSSAPLPIPAEAPQGADEYISVDAVLPRDDLD